MQKEQGNQVNFPELLEGLIAGNDLSFELARELMTQILSNNLSEPKLAALLTALRIKGVTASELHGFVSAMKEFALKVEIENPENAIDTCGTGGDRSGTLNVSTLSAFVLAAAGVKVAKHGNRAASSLTGSADLLEELGVNITLEPEKVAICIEEINIGFLFAPIYHPALKNAANVRKELGFRTVFNFLGPLANPANVGRQIIGVSDPMMLDVIGEVLKRLKIKHALVVHGSGPLDELSVLGTSEVIEVNSELPDDKQITRYQVDALDFGISIATLDDIKGGDKKISAKIAVEVLGGQEGPRSDIVTLNSGAALMIAGVVDTIREGVQMARELLISKKALAKLKELIKLTNELSR